MITDSKLKDLDWQVIAADGEQKAASALREAAEVMSESSAALQLRYLQVSAFALNKIMFILLIDTPNYS